MNTKLTIQLLAIFIAAFSLAIVPGVLSANATVVPTPGNNPNTQWIGTGPASDALRLQYYTGLTGDTNEYDALCFAQPTSCTPAIDLTDVQIPTSEVTSANLADTRFYVTPESAAFDIEHIDFNLANSFFGVEFCNGQDGISSSSTCPDGPGATAIPAACPNVRNVPSAFASEACTFAGIALRQGVAHLVDKASYVANVLQGHGVAVDNMLAAAQATLHSGQDFGIKNPTGTTPANIGPYAVDPTLPIGSQQVFPPYLGGTYSSPRCTTQAQQQGQGGPCYLVVTGVCAWDLLLPCGGSFTPANSGTPSSLVSAEHLTGDGTADANGMVPVGSPDFCAAAQDFFNAGLGTGISTSDCSLQGFTGFNTGTAGTPNGPLLIYRRTSLNRGPLGIGLGTSLCQLIHGTGVTSCAEVSVVTITLAQAGGLVFSTGCRSATELGCSTVGPHRTWSIYSGGNTLGVAVNNLYFFTLGALASDLCGGAPGEKPGQYYMVCNPTNDYWSSNGQLTANSGIAIADTQVANDFMGNHTWIVPLFAHSSQYAWLGGWQGVNNAPGIGIAQGNFYGPLNAWNPSPAVSGPVVRWGQKDSPDTLNPFSVNSVTDFDVISEVYDSLLNFNAYTPASLYGYMVNSYQVVTNAQDANCPTSVTTPSATTSVGGCVKMALRGDQSWQDIYACAPADSACLQSHTVTAQDVKFSFAAFASTGGLISGSTLNVVDVLYNPSSLPASAFSVYGGTQSNGQPEILYIALNQLSAWALNDIAAIPILPQHIWKTATTSAPCLSPTLGSSAINDNGPNQAGSAACSIESTRASGPGSDPIANNLLIGSSGFLCSSGTVGAAGTVYGGGCSTSGNSIPAAGDSITLRRFQYQGTTVSQQGSLNLNFAYFRTNGKFKNFAWADYLAARGSTGTVNGFGAQGTVDIRDIQSVASCLHVAPPYSTAPCNHWSAPAATITTNSAGPNIGVVNGGKGNTVQVAIGTVTQVSRWYSTQFYDQSTVPLLYGVNGNQLNPGAFPQPGTGQNVLNEDGTQETS